MAASEHLNEVLFHGTASKFKKGDIILPAKKTGVERNWGAKSKNDPNYAYAIDDLDSAKYFASVASLSGGDRRPRVYQVEPVNPETSGWREKKFAGGKGGSSTFREHASSEGYRVVKHVWTKRKKKQ